MHAILKQIDWAQKMQFQNDNDYEKVMNLSEPTDEELEEKELLIEDDIFDDEYCKNEKLDEDGYEEDYED